MELPKPIIYVLGFIALILVGNVLLLDAFLVMQKGDLLTFQTRLTQIADRQPTTTVVQSKTVQQPPVVSNDSCPLTCMLAITNATRSAVVRQALNPVVTTPALQTIPSQKGEYFINLGTGSVLPTEGSSSNWKTLDTAQATFDASNYGSIKSATLEVFMHVESSGETHARLFDATTPSIFWTTDLSTGASTSTLLTGPLTLSTGAKTYKIQTYSTLSKGYIDQARIHIVTQ
ncbi:hypothetical protein HY310_02445 [Candidatus Microgenomates bacterium]|nr:hypothetical protein [Candidatus Microgenomates bacterium]